MLTRRFMTVREVAELAQVSEVTVRGWIKTGALRAIDVGREWRIIPRDLEDFLDRHATCAHPSRESAVPAQPPGDTPEG